MSAKYYQFSKKHFEYELREILKRNKSKFMDDITDQWLAQGNETWERIYKISTRNKAVDIILFSSVDMRTNKVREVGGDAVRVVVRWTTKYGTYFKKVAKHYRIETLFKNLEETIVLAKENVFNLNIKQFTKEVTEVA